MAIPLIAGSFRSSLDYLAQLCRRPAFQRAFLMARVALGLVLLLSGSSKITYPHLFFANVYAYELAGFPLSFAASLLIPALEILCGICLVGGSCIRGSLTIAAGLFLVFAMGQFIALLRNLHIQCGCFSVSGSPLDKWTFLRAAILCGIASGLLLADFLIANRIRTGRNRIIASAIGIPPEERRRQSLRRYARSLVFPPI